MRGEDKTRFDSAFFNLRGGIPALIFNKAEVKTAADAFDGKVLE